MWKIQWKMKLSTFSYFFPWLYLQFPWKRCSLVIPVYSYVCCCISWLLGRYSWLLSGSHVVFSIYSTYIVSNLSDTLKLFMQDEAMLTGRSSVCLTVKRDTKKSRPPCFSKYDSNLEANALKNWETKMAERRRQQNYLSSWFFGFVTCFCELCI